MRAEAARCGRIAYTNDIPVYAAYDVGVLQFPGNVVAGTPAELNRALLSGDLDCSPISSFFYAQHEEEFELLPDVCIGSRGAARSIYLIAGAPPALLRDATIAVTKESATARAMLAVICRAQYGFDPIIVESNDPFAEFVRDGTPGLVIGDAAVDASLRVPSACAHDLGALWFDSYDHGMVYAVWAVRRSFRLRAPAEVARIAASLRSSLEWSERHFDRVVAQAQMMAPRPPGFYEEYYRTLKFRFDDQAQQGLLVFYKACASAGLLAAAPSLRFAGEVTERVAR